MEFVSKCFNRIYLYWQNSEIMEGSVIRGPLLYEEAQVKLATKYMEQLQWVRHCRIEGEVNNSSVVWLFLIKGMMVF